MCLDRIIAHETYHFFHALPFKLAPHVPSNNVGHLELKNLSADLFFIIYQLKYLEYVVF